MGLEGNGFITSKCQKCKGYVCHNCTKESPAIRENHEENICQSPEEDVEEEEVEVRLEIDVPRPGNDDVSADDRASFGEVDEDEDGEVREPMENRLQEDGKSEANVEANAEASGEQVEAKEADQDPEINGTERDDANEEDVAEMIKIRKDLQAALARAMAIANESETEKKERKEREQRAKSEAKERMRLKKQEENEKLSPEEKRKSWTVSQLKEACREKGLTVSGKKADLLERLEEAEKKVRVEEEEKKRVEQEVQEEFQVNMTAIQERVRRKVQGNGKEKSKGNPKTRKRRRSKEHEDDDEDIDINNILEGRRRRIANPFTSAG